MCMVDGCDGRVTELTSKYCVARKEHKCEECGRLVLAGETYHYETYVWEGAFNQHKTCRHCMEVRDWLNDECGGFVYGSIGEDIREHSWEGYGISVKMMAVGMERQWKRKDGRMWPLPRHPKASGHDTSQSVTR